MGRLVYRDRVIRNVQMGFAKCDVEVRWSRTLDACVGWVVSVMEDGKREVGVGWHGTGGIWLLTGQRDILSYKYTNRDEASHRITCSIRDRVMAQ
jgi:hypothetical protein